jgi:hypothetical protein
MERDPFDFAPLGYGSSWYDRLRRPSPIGALMVGIPLLVGAVIIWLTG